MELNKINGREIIEFLNNQQKNNEMEDISLNEFHFENQMIRDDQYILYFMSYFDNWGSYQEINNNEIIIGQNGKVLVCLNEPFDGDDDIIESLLEEWIKKHSFQENIEEDFLKLIQTCKENILEIEGFKDKKKIENLIKLLKESITYIK